MVKELRRRTGVCGGTYVAQPHCHHLRANTSTCTFLHQALYSLSMLFTAFLCPLLLRTWEPPQRHYWGDLLATFHFLRWRQHFWNPPIKVADNVTWPDNVASAQVTSSRALPIWDFDRPTKREVATPQRFDSWAICHQTRRWELDGFDFWAPG